MKTIPEDWVRCEPSKCKHNKVHCARFTSPPNGSKLRPMDLSLTSKGDKCAGYEWNGVR